MKLRRADPNTTGSQLRRSEARASLLSCSPSVALDLLLTELRAQPRRLRSTLRGSRHESGDPARRQIATAGLIDELVRMQPLAARVLRSKAPLLLAARSLLLSAVALMGAGMIAG